ncbi:MAG TPA: ABC transporter ATP-binding protein, partial [Caldilineaceae bacterium]|nr:ABC transporter ATP-binding protein [Caldilineaceae bacterium]
TPILSVRDLQVHFQLQEGIVRAVDGASFDVHMGRTLGIVGESGCGKSVTTRALLQIIDPPGHIVGGSLYYRPDNSDRVLDLAQVDPEGAEMNAIRGGDIGLIFQEPMTSFSPVHTIGNQIMEAIRLHHPISKAEAREQAIEWLHRVHMPNAAQRINEYPYQLSGGLRQRAMIAMALCCNPRILIADEPSTALDVTTQAQILDLLGELQAEHGMAIIFITHDLGVIAEIADDVAVMYLGRVVEEAPVDQIFHAPQHPYTRALLTSMPNIYSQSRARLPSIQGSIPHPLNRPAGCAFHPRCPSFMPGICETAEPELIALTPTHQVSCFLYEDRGKAERKAETKPAQVAVAATNGHATPAKERSGQSGVPLLEVKNLTKFFPIQKGFLRRVVGHVRAVDDISFTLNQGETLSLVGESGCGKTTTARCVLRAIDPTGGTIMLKAHTGQTIDLATLSESAIRPLRRDMQMIFQDPFSSLNPRMTIFDVIGEPLLVNGVSSRRERQDRVEQLLKQVGLRPEYMDRFPHAFSGGQRQRIGIARALALNPRFIVADEAVSALDVSVQAQVLNLMMDLQDELGLTYLFVSHDLSVVNQISDRVVVMYVGKIAEVATPQQLFSNPKHPYTAALIASLPKVDPRLRQERAPLQGEVANPANPPSGCYFHPRCPYAVEQCKQESPPLIEIENGRLVSCHRVHELELVGIES